MTYDDLMKLIELFRQNPVAGLIAALPWIALGLRWILANAPAPTPGTWWATVAAVLKVIAGVIPTAKVDATSAQPRVQVPVDTPQDMSAADTRIRRRRPLVRAAIRVLATANKIPVSDEILDIAVQHVEDEVEAGDGPLQSLLEWIKDNPEIIIALIKALVAAFAAPKQNDASEVSA